MKSVVAVVVCFGRNRVDGDDDIIEVIGSIRDGSVHGVAKITVVGGSVHIGRYMHLYLLIVNWS